MDKEKVCAIIPSYNEGKRIEKVIVELKQCSLIDKIIVSDDGSTDNTEEIVKKYPEVNYIKNNINMGKGYAMDIAVKNTDAEIIFFCDADLDRFSYKMAEEIIKPVLDKKYKMFLGVRDNLWYKFVSFVNFNCPLFFLSGIRAIRKQVWNEMPDFYKKSYRVEVGMNCFEKGFGYKLFDFNQVIKECKYGLLKSQIKRWGMNLDIFTSYLKFNIK